MDKKESKSGTNFKSTEEVYVGSKKSKFQIDRNLEKEAEQLIEDEINKIVDANISKIPPEIVEKLNVSSSIKDNLYNYVNLNVVNMFNRSLSVIEDELLVKFNKMVEKEEEAIQKNYKPRPLAKLIDQIGDPVVFNLGENEKSIFNIFNQLQDYINSSLINYENETNQLLDQQTYVGAAIKGENAYSIVKCSFKDDPSRPNTVYNVKLSINILEGELISPIYHEYVSYEYLVKEIISKHIQESIQERINKILEEPVEEHISKNKEYEATFFEKLNMVKDYVEDDENNPNSIRYKYISKSLIDRLEGLKGYIENDNFDQLNIRENIKKILDFDNIRGRGYNTSVNAITSILNSHQMDYQFVENLKNARQLVIREYENPILAELPDERYQIQLTYYDHEQLTRMRESYNRQTTEFRKELKRLMEVVDAIYQSRKRYSTINDFEDLYRTVEKDVIRLQQDINPEVDLTSEKLWDEYGFVEPELGDSEEFSNTFLHRYQHSNNMLKAIKQKINNIYEHQNPIEKVILLDRLNFLERQVEDFYYEINPYQLQPGLVLDIDIVSIKKIQYTLFKIAGVINDFIQMISQRPTTKEID